MGSMQILLQSFACFCLRFFASAMDWILQFFFIVYSIFTKLASGRTRTYRGRSLWGTPALCRPLGLTASFQASFKRFVECEREHGCVSDDL
ncbi:hypothetical protein XENTR_v10018213 [Xenopus tropicalis]|nr:hypothetical protein XENTR_v10018213 [Xenopus tropicalis]